MTIYSVLACSILLPLQQNSQLFPASVGSESL